MGSSGGVLGAPAGRSGGSRGVLKLPLGGSRGVSGVDPGESEGSSGDRGLGYNALLCLKFAYNLRDRNSERRLPKSNSGNLSPGDKSYLKG